MLEVLNGGIRRLIPNDPSHWLTNGETYSQLIYLGKDADSSEWQEVTQEEYEATMPAKVNAE